MSARNIIIAVAAVLALPGCRGGSAPARPRVALLLSTLQEERYQKDQRYFEEAARRIGLNPFTLAADNDNARQLAQVEDALSRGARVLVVQPTDSNAALAYVKKAHERGARIVAYDRGIGDGAAPPGERADFYVAHDAYRLGALQAQAALEATGGKGSYVLLHGQSGHSVVREIARGYMDALRDPVKSGRVRIVAEKHHDSWSPEQALRTVEDAITKEKGAIDAILAMNSGMARGAVQAIRSAGLQGKGIFIAGSDADAANIGYVCEGVQSVEVLKEIRPLAEKAAEVAGALARGQAPPADPGTPPGHMPVAFIPVHLVRKADVKRLILDSGFHPPSAVPACR